MCGFVQVNNKSYPEKSNIIAGWKKDNMYCNMCVTLIYSTSRKQQRATQKGEKIFSQD